MKRRLTTTLLALLAPALLLTGCFGVETSIVVNEDGSGTQSVRFALPAELATSFSDEIPDVSEMESEPELQALREALGDRGSMEFFSNAEDGIGFVMTINVGPSDDFGAALLAASEEVQAAMPADLVDTEMTSLMAMADNVFDLRREGDEWIYEQELAIDPDMMNELAGEDDVAGMASMFLAQTTIAVKLKLPGEVTEHNADEVLEDGTLVWTSTGADAPRTLMARSDVSSGIPRGVLIGLLVGGIALVALFVGFLVFGRRRT